MTVPAYNSKKNTSAQESGPTQSHIAAPTLHLFSGPGPTICLAQNRNELNEFTVLQLTFNAGQENLAGILRVV
jgi:hypothetical protein